jgi:hypothetical protein
MRILAHVDQYKQIVPKDCNAVLRYVGKDIWISIHTQPSPGLRSDQSNRYLWAGVYASICEATGNDPETVHLALKREAVRLGVLEPEYVLIGDQLIEAEPTTRTDADTFSRYIDWIKGWALEHLGIVIPEPEEGA